MPEQRLDLRPIHVIPAKKTTGDGRIQNRSDERRIVCTVDRMIWAIERVWRAGKATRITYPDPQTGQEATVGALTTTPDGRLCAVLINRQVYPLNLRDTAGKRVTLGDLPSTITFDDLCLRGLVLPHDKRPSLRTREGSINVHVVETHIGREIQGVFSTRAVESLDPKRVPPQSTTISFSRGVRESRESRAVKVHER